MSTPITISRYNTIQSRIQAVLGTSNTGYGQPVNSTQLVQTSGVPLLIEASAMNKLRGDLSKARVHQTGAAMVEENLPTAVSRVTKISDDMFLKYETCIKDIEDNRYVMASNQSYTLAVAQTSSRTTPWNTTVSHVVKVTFNAAIDANYFFNAGGVFTLTPAFTPSPTPNAKTTSWKTLIDSIGVINIDRVDFALINGSLNTIRTVSAAGSYSDNKFIVKAQFVTNVLTISIEFQDNVGGGSGFDEAVSGTLSSSVGYKVAKSDISFSLGTTVAGVFQPNFTTATDTRLDQTGVSSGYAVSLTPASLVVAEGDNVTINIATNQAPSNTIWYEITGKTANNTPISIADFAGMTSLVNQVTLGNDGRWSGLWQVAPDAITDSTSMDVTIYASDPRLLPTPTALATTVGKTPSQTMLITDTSITIGLNKLTPSGSTISEKAETATFQFTTTNDPLSATWTIATTTGRDLSTIFENITGTVTPIANNTGLFTIKTKPNFKTTGDTPITVKVNVGSYESLPISMTVTDDSKPIIAYHSTKEPNLSNDPTKGNTAYTHDSELYFTITGGKPNGAFTFTRVSGGATVSLTMDSSGNYPATGVQPHKFDSLNVAGKLYPSITFTDTNETQNFTIDVSEDISTLTITKSPHDITYTKTMQIEFEMSHCWSEKTVKWELVEKPVGVYFNGSPSTQSGTITTTGNAGTGIGVLVLETNSTAIRGNSFTVKFTPDDLLVTSKTTDAIRIIDAFPFSASFSTTVHLPTLAGRVSFAAGGGGGGGGGSNGGSSGGQIYGGAGGDSNGILTTHSLPSGEHTLIAVVGGGGKGGFSFQKLAGGGAGGVGLIQIGGKGGDAGSAPSDGGTGAGGGGGAATIIGSSTALFAIAGGGGGGGGGAWSNNYGLPGGSCDTVSSNISGGPGTDGGFTTTLQTSGGGGGGGNRGIGGAHGSDSGPKASGGTGGLLSYNSATVYNSIKYKMLTNSGGAGSTYTGLDRVNRGDDGSDGGVVVFVSPSGVRNAVAVLNGSTATLTFSQPLIDGASDIIDYTASSGSYTVSGTSPLTITGLTYTTPPLFTITANNEFGAGVKVITPTQTAIVLATDYASTPSAKFGTSVAMSGDGTKLVVGSPYAGSNGSVYVYSKSGAIWAPLGGPITASNGAAGDLFGCSVDITFTGDRIVVGARGKALNTGANYVFRLSGSSWIEEQYILQSGGSDDFSGTVSIDKDGNRFVLGSYKDDGNGTSAGSVRVYKRTGNTWASEKAFNGSSSNSYLGWSTDITDLGDRVISGQYLNGLTGTVVIYKRTTAWTTEQTIYGSDSVAGDSFGWSVAISGDGTRAVIGAPDCAIGQVNGVGAIYVYYRNLITNQWDLEKKLHPNLDPTANTHFGYSVAINSDGTKIIAGMPDNSPSNLTSAGSVYEFVRESGSTSWKLEKGIISSNAAAGDKFGSSIAFDSTGSIAAIGAPEQDPTGVTGAGSAYTFQI